MRLLGRRGVVILMIVMVLAVIPATVMAQAASLDPEARASVESLAKEIGYRVVPSLSRPVDIGQIIEDPAPAPEAEEPKLEPVDEPLVLPELDLTDLAEYTNDGVTIQVPADWNVEVDPFGDTLFYIEIPDTDLMLSLDADAGLDFPSLLGVALFRSQADLLTRDFGSEAQVEASATVFTPQDLPVAKLVFLGEDAGTAIAGTFYVVAPNENTYMLLAGGSQKSWEYAAEGIELIAQSITFDEELITLVAAGDEAVTHTDSDETLEVTVPGGWYAMDTGDLQFPVILAEPEIRYVAAIGSEAVFDAEFDPEILELATRELAPEEYDTVINTVIDIVADSGNPMLLDEERSNVFPREGAVTVRLVGGADLGDGLSMPVVFYADIRSSGVAVVAVFGDVEGALGQEDEILALVESVMGLE
jgi:hypothetical protein